jgi:hypothetical protein
MISVQPKLGKLVLDDLGTLHVLPSVPFQEAVKTVRSTKKQLHAIAPIVIVHQLDSNFPFLQVKQGGKWKLVSPRF